MEEKELHLRSAQGRSRHSGPASRHLVSTVAPAADRQPRREGEGRGLLLKEPRPAWAVSSPGLASLPLREAVSRAQVGDSLWGSPPLSPPERLTGGNWDWSVSI